MNVKQSFVSFVKESTLVWINVNVYFIRITKTTCLKRALFLFPIGDVC